MRKPFLLFLFMLPLMAFAQQTPAGSTQQSLMMNDAVPVPPAAEPSPGGDEKIYTLTEELAEFPGGQSAMMAYLGKHLQYPEDAREAKKQGTVYLTFVVNMDGKIVEVRVLRGLYPSLDQEAIRVVSSMPNWKPGKQGGKAVRTQFNLPVKFLLK